MAQIEALDQFYQDQVSKSLEKFGIVQKIDLKARHHPQNPIFFRRFFFNCVKVINYGPQKLFLVILCDFRSFGTHLEQNE